MTNQQEKLAPISETSPLKGKEFVEDYEEAVTSSGCGCFQGLCYGWRQNNNGGTHRYVLHQQEETKDQSWLVNKVKEAKEISEVLAGPKWKNFIRRFRRKRRMQFQYDPQSYALNFDDWINRAIDGGYLDFCARYAAPVGINKGELGRQIIWFLIKLLLINVFVAYLIYLFCNTFR